MSRPGNLSIKSSDGSVLLSRPGPQTQKTNKKACFIVFERFAVFTTTGSKLPKQALVF
jgi:hypothetical protein